MTRHGDPQPTSADDSPLLGGAAAWNRLIESVGPASMLVVIEARLGRDLRGRVSAEDVWQDALLHAWRDREQCRWAGLGSFRRWLLGIVEHRIRDAVDFHRAGRRSVRQEQPLRGRSDAAGATTWLNEPLRTTTPSRLALHREQAEQMRDALAAVPEPEREVLRLRLFEGWTIPQVAERLGLGESAAKHRYRKGAGLYRDQLRRRLGSRVDPIP